MADLPDDIQNQPLSPAGSIIKEKESPVGPEALGNQEEIPVVEVGRIPEKDVERAGNLQYLPKETFELEEQIKDDQGRILVTSPAAQTPKIVLPLLEESYLNPKNWHRPVTEALRWLLEWTKRIIKMKPGEAVFRESH